MGGSRGGGGFGSGGDFVGGEIWAVQGGQMERCSGSEGVGNRENVR